MRPRTRLLIAGATVLVVASIGTLMGCSTPANAPVSPARALAIEFSVTEAERAVKLYLDATPACPAPAPCAAPALRATLIHDSHAARDAVIRSRDAAAADAPAAMALAQAALTRLIQETPVIPAQKQETPHARGDTHH